MKQSQNSIYKVQAVDRALDILDCFSFQNKEWSLSEIAIRTGLNKTTVKRLISNLVDREYLRQTPPSKKYQLGMRLFEMGGIVFSSFSLRQAAAVPMTRLQSETGATVLLGVRIDNQLVYVDKREGDGMIRISSGIGWRRPLHFGMLGMVLMASLDPGDVRTILTEQPLQAHTPFSITDDGAFGLRLEQIRHQGYIVEKEEAVEGAIGIAAPVKDHTRQVAAVLGIALPLGQRQVDENLDRFVGLVKTTCETISSELGYLKK